MVVKNLYYIKGFSYLTKIEHSKHALWISDYLIALKYVEYEPRGFRIIKIK